jgi:pimeloyl-ACP methyl ester carboxylesterase
MVGVTRRWFGFAILGGLAACSALGNLARAENEPAADIAGTWQGALDVGVVKLRLGLEFKKKEGGGFTGTMDSPDQGAFGMEIDEVTVEEQSVKFVMKKIGGSYDGKLSDDSKEISGKWTQGASTLSLVLKRGEKLGPPKRPQEPKPPYPYLEEEVSYENSQAGIKLAGTLTLPKEGGPFPAVLLITGSGAQNRNEELMGHKPFLLWADYLTRRGIAVLRVDDRGVGGSGGEIGKSTIEDHAGDALAGVAYLKTRKEIDAAKIGLLGHSEGAVVAPAAAVQSSDVAFIVLLAGTGVTGEEILYRQGALIAKAAGATDEAVTASVELQRKLFAILKAEPDDLVAAEKLAAVIVEAITQLTDEERAAVGDASKVSLAQVSQMLNPWFRHFLSYDPQPVLEKVKCPVLAINGEKDLQVEPAQNLPVIEAALKSAGNADVTVKELPGLNHLFQASKTGAILEYSEIEETINPAALELVAEWIAERTKAK